MRKRGATYRLNHVLGRRAGSNTSERAAFDSHITALLRLGSAFVIQVDQQGQAHIEEVGKVGEDST